jgi:hypothetical protein
MQTNADRDAALNALDSHFLGLIKGITDLRAGTVTEAAYSGYGTRPAITFGAAGDTTPAGGRQRANSASVSQPVNGGSNEDQIAYGVWSAATGGTLKRVSFLDADPPIVGTADTADLITTQAVHGLVADQRVFVMASPGLLLPTGLAENTAYFVLATGLTTTAFKLSTTSGGAAVDITAGGGAMFMPYTPVTVAAGATPTFAIGAIVIQE